MHVTVYGPWTMIFLGPLFLFIGLAKNLAQLIGLELTLITLISYENFNQSPSLLQDGGSGDQVSSNRQKLVEKWSEQDRAWLAEDVIHPQWTLWVSMQCSASWATHVQPWATHVQPCGRSIQHRKQQQHLQMANGKVCMENVPWSDYKMNSQFRVKS